MMRKFRNQIVEKNELLCMLTGLAVVLAALGFYMILGEQAIVTYHDQLDGEVPAYLYQSKYLFSRTDLIPEFLNGATKSTLTAAAPLGILFYKILPPFFAFVAMQIFVMIVAYLGMFALVLKSTKKAIPAMVTGLLFAYLPLLSVYGLGMFGIPLLLYALWNLYEDKNRIRNLLFILLFVEMSSLVLVGYACLVLLVIFMIYTWIRDGRQVRKQERKQDGKQDEKRNWVKIVSIRPGFYGALPLMVIFYLLNNLSLIGQVLGIGNSMVSHKEELVLESASFGDTFKTTFLEGGLHTGDLHKYFLPFIILVLLIGFVKRNRAAKKKEIFAQKSLYIVVLACFLLNFAIALFSGLWHSGFMVALRNIAGGPAVYFQLDRFYWISPGLWYFSFGICLYLLWYDISRFSLVRKAVLILLCCVFGLVILKDSMIKPNLQKLINPDYKAISWSDFYASDVLAQVEEFIGQDKEEYRVVSLGICPAAALYNGFYCLDGYSNNYDLAYKQQFRKVIAPELEKSEYLREYYDDWGNRCYLLSAEIPAYYTVEKGGFYFADLDLDTQVLKNMGCDYIFSAAYIDSAQDLGLTLLREEPFETSNSYYRIFLYQIN